VMVASGDSLEDTARRGDDFHTNAVTRQ
jgi:hypothetical protein